MDLKLETLGDGAVSEKFEQELKKVIKNICDPNTPAATIREVNLKIRIKPTLEDRGVGEMEYVVTSKLAPTKTVISRIHVGMNADGEVNAAEVVQPTQGQLFPPPQDGDGVGKVSHISSMKKANG